MLMIKVAVIGLGRMGLMYDFEEKREPPSSHVLAYEMNGSFQLVAAMDIHSEQEQFLHQLAPNTLFYSDLLEMLTAHPDLGVVSICTPPEGRYDIIADIVRLSTVRVIFCEKPLAKSVNDALKIQQLVLNSGLILIPNLSRRWNVGITEVRAAIESKKYGQLEKIHLRYTRGIYNTGSHIFDLVRYYAGVITSVQVINQVKTSSISEGEPSYSFNFATSTDVTGFAEAFNDENYYMFELDLYLERGKIEIITSGDEIKYYSTGPHPLFQGFKNLQLDKVEKSLLSQSNNLELAIKHIADIIQKGVPSICFIEDGVYPLLVAETLIRSFQNQGSNEKVTVNNYE
jgi:predicted dehydrogenase